MKLLVTGGAGFIGSAVIRRAIRAGHSVVNLDKLTYAGSLTNVAEVADSPAYAFEKADICDRPAVDAILDRHKPDAIMHLAAESHVDRSIDGPAAFMETNIIGTYTMLEAARAYWTAQGKPDSFRFHHISTDEVFGSLPADPGVKFTEDTPYDPRSPYSASKASSDHLVRAWAETYGLPVVLTNCSNNYGPYHFPEKLIPVVILKALAGAPIPIYGKGDNNRDWLYVEDHADALLLVVQKGALGRSYNIGGRTRPRTLSLCRRSARSSMKSAPATPPMPGRSPSSPTAPAMTSAMPSTRPASARNWAGAPRSRWMRGWRRRSTGILRMRTGGARFRTATASDSGWERDKGMITVHLPAGYLLGRGFNRPGRFVLPAALVGAVFPDFDLAYFVLIDNWSVHHHRYWVHVPFFWMILCAVILPVVLILALPAGHAMAIPLIALHIVGLLSARWLFFAEAAHVVRLYYGK